MPSVSLSLHCRLDYALSWMEVALQEALMDLDIYSTSTNQDSQRQVDRLSDICLSLVIYWDLGGGGVKHF